MRLLYNELKKLKRRKCSYFCDCDIYTHLSTINDFSVDGGRNLINSVVSSALKIIEITKFNYFYFFFLLLILSVIVDNGMFPSTISGPLFFFLDGNQTNFEK